MNLIEKIKDKLDELLERDSKAFKRFNLIRSEINSLASRIGTMKSAYDRFYYYNKNNQLIFECYVSEGTVYIQAFGQCNRVALTGTVEDSLTYIADIVSKALANTGKYKV